MTRTRASSPQATPTSPNPSRQSDTTESHAIHHSADVQEAVAEFHETVTEYEPEEDAAVSFRVDPVSPREFRQSAVVEELPAAEAHEVHEVPKQAHEESRQAHETEPASGQHFAPGNGRLEEEILDDEDGEIAHLHAGAHDDDLEEETLEHAADLGSMIRDMSIDEITRPEPSAEEEEDDFDEDDEDFEEDELESNGEAPEDDELSGSEVSETEEEGVRRDQPTGRQRSGRCADRERAARRRTSRASRWDAAMDEAEIAATASNAVPAKVEASAANPAAVPVTVAAWLDRVPATAADGIRCRPAICRRSATC